MRVDGEVSAVFAPNEWRAGQEVIHGPLVNQVEELRRTIAKKNELFFHPVAAGATAEVRLHNFWSNETGRPFPTNGKMTVEVTLAEAKWMDVKTENGAEVWTAAGPIEGLPVSKSVTLTLKKSASPR